MIFPVVTIIRKGLFFKVFLFFPVFSFFFVFLRHHFFCFGGSCVKSDVHSFILTDCQFDNCFAFCQFPAVFLWPEKCFPWKDIGMVHTGFKRQPRPFVGWMGALLFLVFCQLALAAGVMAAEAGKKAAVSNGQLSKNAAAENEDVLRDLLELRRNADSGDVSAQFELSRRYLNGDGLEQNDDEAIRWLRMAAEGGLPRAQAGLGWMYAAGRGVQKDETLSFSWYERSALAGFPVAQWMLGRCYERGIGVAKDRLLARQWYEKAAAQGNEKAKKRLHEWR